MGRKGEVTVIGMHFCIGMSRAGEHIQVLYHEDIIMFLDPRPPKEPYTSESAARRPSTKS